MGSPTPTARVTPTANIMETGFRALVTFALDPDIALWEKTVTPAGVDGGEPVNTTTQHNQSVVTKAPNSTLYEYTDGQILCAYDRIVYGHIIAIINKNTTVTWLFPDGGTFAAFGFLRSFTPNAIERGQQPEATAVIVISNIDPSDGSEGLPVVSAAVGTP